MPLNCPQRGDNLRLQSAHDAPRRRSQRHRWPIGAAMIVAAAGLAAGYFLLAGAPPAPSHSGNHISMLVAPATQWRGGGRLIRVGGDGDSYCDRDFTDKASRRDDVAGLQAAGGLNHIFSQGHMTPPFKCAAYYLALGLDINATSPTTGLTPLHYAINANVPLLVTFLIDHGADLHKKAGEHQLEPMGYVYYLALNNRAINRSQVISIINKALTKAASQL